MDTREIRRTGSDKQSVTFERWHPLQTNRNLNIKKDMQSSKRKQRRPLDPKTHNMTGCSRHFRPSGSKRNPCAFCMAHYCSTTQSLSLFAIRYPRSVMTFCGLRLLRQRNLLDRDPNHLGLACLSWFNCSHRLPGLLSAYFLDDPHHLGT